MDVWSTASNAETAVINTTVSSWSFNTPIRWVKRRRNYEDWDWVDNKGRPPPETNDLELLLLIESWLAWIAWDNFLTSRLEPPVAQPASCDNDSVRDRRRPPPRAPPD